MIDIIYKLNGFTYMAAYYLGLNRKIFISCLIVFFIIICSNL